MRQSIIYDQPPDPQALQPAKDDLPAVQCLNAEHHAIDVECPVAHPRATKLLEFYRERRRFRVAARFLYDLRTTFNVISPPSRSPDQLTTSPKILPGKPGAEPIWSRHMMCPVAFPTVRHQPGVETEHAATRVRYFKDLCHGRRAAAVDGRNDARMCCTGGGDQGADEEGRDSERN